MILFVVGRFRDRTPIGRSCASSRVLLLCRLCCLLLRLLIPTSDPHGTLMWHLKPLEVNVFGFVRISCSSNRCAYLVPYLWAVLWHFAFQWFLKSSYIFINFNWCHCWLYFHHVTANLSDVHHVQGGKQFCIVGVVILVRSRCWGLDWRLHRRKLCVLASVA